MVGVIVGTFAVSVLIVIIRVIIIHSVASSKKEKIKEEITQHKINKNNSRYENIHNKGGTDDQNKKETK